MAKKFSDVIEALPKEDQQYVDAKAAELVALELTLQELRKTRDFTQEQLAEIMDLGQENLSRLENRADARISTLQTYIQALGGQLKLVAEFPDSERVEISGFENKG